MKTPRVLPPHYFVLSLVTMLGLDQLLDSSLLPGKWHLVGIVPIAIGLAIAVAAARQFQNVETNITPLTESTTLVTDGIFRVTRNPMYVGMIGVLTGTALLLDNLWPWIAIVPFLLVVRVRFIRPEEVLMEDTFGEHYRDYKASVRRWL